jgi:8-oxo-dGTP diphosphatase
MISKPKKIHVVTVFLENEGRILILRRSQQVRTMKTKWAGISGYIEGEDPLFQAWKEIEEETGLSNEKVKLIRVGKPVNVVDSDNTQTIWIVHPYLFHSDTKKISIDWEHDEYRWIKPQDIQNYEAVPKLKEALDSIISMNNKQNV